MAFQLFFVVVQVEATPTTNVKIGGRVAYLLWRSVYAVKQVDVRNRVSQIETYSLNHSPNFDD